MLTSVQVHQKIRKFACVDCSRRFTRRDTLVRWARPVTVSADFLQSSLWLTLIPDTNSMVAAGEVLKARDEQAQTHLMKRPFILLRNRHPGTGRATKAYDNGPAMD